MLRKLPGRLCSRRSLTTARTLASVGGIKQCRQELPSIDSIPHHRIIPKKLPYIHGNPSVRSIFSLSKPEWHHPSFMQDATLEAKEEWLESAIDHDSRIDSAAFMVVLNDLATSNQSGSPQKAEGWIQRLELKAVSNPQLQPTVQHYNAVIQSWANSKEDASLSLVRAERWLNKLSNEKESVSANTDSYNAFLDAISKGRTSRRKADIARQHAEKAQDTLDYMIEQQEQLGAD